jgi:predicted DNA-binding transcriptional regulator AlpA
MSLADDVDRALDGLTLRDLEQDGPPIRLRDLSKLTGFSKDKFYLDIDRGDLQAKPVKTRSRVVYMVERDEALRYLRAIKFAA